MNWYFVCSLFFENCFSIGTLFALCFLKTAFQNCGFNGMCKDELIFPTSNFDVA